MKAPVILAMLVILTIVSGVPTTFRLERRFPVDNVVDLNEVKFRDRVRHDSVADFPVYGNSGVGLYYTRVQLGSPPKEYYVQIDTGSDLMWISCDKCNGCPTHSELQIPIQHYDPASSSTASMISCSDKGCATCSGANNLCSYTVQYGDKSTTSGFYVSDQIHLHTFVGDSTVSNASASIVFGCSTTQTGILTESATAVDGLFGFGRQGLSLIAQLSSQGVAGDVFSHCFVGNGIGGGILVLGQIVEPSLVYTPLIASQTYYNVNLLSISVNGQTLSIDPSMFAKSGSRVGTIIDSGTTLVYLPKEAHASFMHAITKSVSQSVQFVMPDENPCYIATSRTHFPNVSLNFAGGATMFLRPQDYLLPVDSEGGAVTWCMGFQVQTDPGMTTILGDLVLKDRVVVYDLGGQRIGWANYDCRSSVNVSTTSTGGQSDHVNAGHIGSSSSLSLIVAFGFIIASIS